MGMYTRLHFNAEIKPGRPEVVKLLKHMTGHEGIEPAIPDHPLFKTDRWDWMLQSSSYYFSYVQRAELHQEKNGDELLTFLSVDCDLKNYDSEIKKFLDWIMPHVYAGAGEFLGYHMYEEATQPTLIYLPSTDPDGR